MTVSHGFELLRAEAIPELNTTARLFRHVKTGAELLSLENDDENKCFGIAFRTPVADSTGVAHILEHSVLCGSRKYPVREPFKELLKSSLQTFLNAFTYPDKTCYPVASQNLKDFYNLIDVYLDAVFYPLLPQHVFEQEGWHYEMESLDVPLSYRGVVFNEMKGVYASPDNIVTDNARRSLFPDTGYSFDYGGYPPEIVELNHDYFLAYHRTYYHPANARIYFYGDDPAEERLRLLDNWLSEFEPQVIDSTIALQPAFTTPRRLERPFIAGEDGKGFVTLNWLLPETSETETNLGLGILGHILIGAPASPLRKALIESGLGEDLAGVGLDTDLRQMSFSTGLKGVDLQDADKVETLILETLQRLAENGIDPRTVEASLNTVEFGLRENNTGRFPRGLALMLRSLTTWLYDADPLAPLAFEAPLNAVKARLSTGERYFEDLIRRHLLQNPHRTTLIMRPDPNLHTQWEEEETARLAGRRAAMTADELQAVVENTRTLRQLQDTPDSPAALATIPMLTLADLDRQNKVIPLRIVDYASSRILYHDLFTNGITYLDVGFNLRALPQTLLPYVPLFARALLEMGTEHEDFVSLSQRIGSKTGGIDPDFLTASARASNETVAWLFLRGKATVGRTQELLDILGDVLLTARLDDRERFRQMVLEEKATQEAQLLPAGHAVVNARLRSYFTLADWVAEQMGGVSYLFFLRRLTAEVEADWASVRDKLEQLRTSADQCQQQHLERDPG